MVHSATAVETGVVATQVCLHACDKRPHVVLCGGLDAEAICIDVNRVIIVENIANTQVYNLSTQKQPSCKKGAALCKMAGMKKIVAAKKWL